MTLNRRKADICRAMAQLETDEATEAGRLGTLPSIPEDVTVAGAKLVDRIWISAHETASLALSELRARLADTQTRQRRQLVEVEQMLEGTEQDLDAAAARAAAAEGALSEAREEIARLQGDLTRAEVKLEFRDDLLSLMQLTPTKSDRAVRNSKSAADDSSKPDTEDGRPETGDLPFSPQV